MVRVLVVEDDVELLATLGAGLRSGGFAVDLAASVGAATDLLMSVRYDAMCLDLNLGDGDGMELCRQLGTAGLLRPNRVLMLTARDAVASRVEGLYAGADDYVIKPFDFGELIARLHALGRRANEVSPGVLAVGDLVVNVPAHRVTRNGVDIPLTSREFMVVEFLAGRAGDVVSIESILEHCWDAQANPFSESARVLIGRIRQKLGQPPLVETVRGAGYRLCAPGR